jgi:hypothetical protein
MVEQVEVRAPRGGIPPSIDWSMHAKARRSFAAASASFRKCTALFMFTVSPGVRPSCESHPRPNRARTRREEKPFFHARFSSRLQGSVALVGAGDVRSRTFKKYLLALSKSAIPLQPLSFKDGILLKYRSFQSRRPRLSTKHRTRTDPAAPAILWV